MELSGPDYYTKPQPTVGGAYEHSFDTMKKSFIELLLIIIISALLFLPLGIVEAAMESSGDVSWQAGLFNFFYGILIGIPLEFGVAWAFLKAVRGEKVEIRDLFVPFNNWLNVMGAGILSGIIIGFGILLLIIPGIIFACKLAFVPYLVMDKDMEPVAAIKKSWEMTNGYAITIFLMYLLAIPVAILGFILLIVGIIPASMWIEGAFASIYEAVHKRQQPEMVENA